MSNSNSNNIDDADILISGGKHQKTSSSSLSSSATDINSVLDNAVASGSSASMTTGDNRYGVNRTPNAFSL